MHTIRKRTLSVIGLLGLVLSPALAFAAKPHFDTGAQINTSDDIYKETQVVSDVFADKAIYGKLEGDTPVDIYTFTPDRDGEQTFALLASDKLASTAAPTLIFVDPTDATESQQLGIPLPSNDYHAAIVTAIEGQRYFNEPLLFKRYQVFAEQSIKLTAGKTYHLIVLDQTSSVVDYTIRLGNGKSWKFSDFFKSFGSWMRVKTDWYAGTSPFHFSGQTVGFLIMILGFTILMGIWVVEQIFAALANRLKMAGYLLIKLQPYSRIFIWASAWFTLLGGYIYFAKVGWEGVPFMLGVIAVLLVAELVTYTFTISKRLQKIEVQKQEATISRKAGNFLYLHFTLTLLGFGSFITLLSMYLVGK